MPSLYSCRCDGDQYRITKFDSDFNPESSYLCSLTECECPAGHRPICRHRTMLPKFVARKAVDTFWLYDFDRDGWVSGPAVEDDEVDEYVTYSEVEAALPSGIIFLDLSDPASTHNAIADVLVEPRLSEPKPASPTSPAPTKFNRRGF